MNLNYFFEVANSSNKKKKNKRKFKNYKFLEANVLQLLKKANFEFLKIKTY